MASKSSGVPDASTLAEIRQMIACPKTWVASGEIPWVDADGRPRGYRFRQPLALADGTRPANLVVAGYFMPSNVQGGVDKLSLSLILRFGRVFGVDEDGPTGHFNSVGLGRPYFGRRIGHPQVHTISDDAIEGYAEPLEKMPYQGYWDYFVTKAGIVSAPRFTLPPQQLGLRV